MNSKTVAAGRECNGTHQTVNFEMAKSKVNTAVTMQMGDPTVR